MSHFTGVNLLHLRGVNLTGISTPKPGFLISQTQGCTSLIANITDTITKNVLSKQYWFSDNATWKNIPVNQKNFSHIFTKKGNCTIIQKLTGISGCVTQEDTVELQLISDLTNKDTLHILNATIENHNTYISWNRQEAAIEYSIYKNGNLIGVKSTLFSLKTNHILEMPFW